MRLFFFFIFLSVFACAQVSLVKGPYLQIGTPGSIIIKWQTNIVTNTKCSYGTNSASLNLSYQNNSADTIHEAFLSGLMPYQKYYYSIGSSTLTIQGDTTNYFVTSPVQGTPGQYRFWVTGDCGNNSINQIEVRNKYLAYNSNKHTDGWLLLGDNAYFNGLDGEYNTNFFAHYQTNIMKHTVLWPSPGNHDYANSLLNQNSHSIAYYSVFNLPTNGEAGGVWSGTEAFYSYNYGNVHFVSLDSYGHELNQFRLFDTLGPQVTWLKQDLASNTLPWVVVYFHHPPYSMGSHNSDTEGELDSIRKNLVRILERHNVDFVFSGHSHSYERSKLMNGHFGYENSFNPAIYHLSTSSALYNGSANSCPYIKNNGSKGTVYIVSGSAGSMGGQQASFPHDAMCYSNTTEGGSLIMDITNNRADFRWLCADGVIRDSFTVFKNVNKVTTYSVSIGQSLMLAASWTGNYSWSNGAATQNQIIIANSDTLFWVKDNFNCLADSFKIKVLAGMNELTQNNIKATVYPNPSSAECTVRFEIDKPGNLNLSLITPTGNKTELIKNKQYEKGIYTLKVNAQENKLSAGVYCISFDLNGKETLKKLVVLP